MEDAVGELRPEIVRVVQKRDAVEALQGGAKHAVTQIRRAAHGHHLLLEQEIRQEAGSEKRTSLGNRDVDAVRLEIRQAFSA